MTIYDSLTDYADRIDAVAARLPQTGALGARRSELADIAAELRAELRPEEPPSGLGGQQG